MRKRINKLTGLVIIGLLVITIFTACGETKPSGTYAFEKMILEFNGATATILPSDISDTHIGGLDALDNSGVDTDNENFQLWANVWIRNVSKRTYTFSGNEILTNKESNSDTLKFRLDGKKIVLLDENGNEINTQDGEMAFDSKKIVLRSLYDADNTMTVYYKKT